MSQNLGAGIGGPIYIPLNGKELREIGAKGIRQFAEVLENHPAFKEGLSYHRAHIQLAFKITAYPADVPTPPQLDDSFIVQHQDFSEAAFQESYTNIVKARQLQENIDSELGRLMSSKEELKSFIEKAELTIVDMKEEKDNGQPDAVRIKNDLPVLRTQMNGPQIAQVPTKLNIGTKDKDEKKEG